MTIEIIAFDADDTLWQNEVFFRFTQDRFAELLGPYMGPDPLHARLLAAERANIGHYGYGVKGFMLSLIETALDVSNGQVPGSVIAEILHIGKELLAHPLELIDGVEKVLRQLTTDHQLYLITKGDLLHQERKLAQSGLGDLFDEVHIVSEKDIATYARIFSTQASRALMIGNSMKSDILPPLEIGAAAVHIPHGIEWEIEAAPNPINQPRFYALNSITELPKLLPKIR